MGSVTFSENTSYEKPTRRHSHVLANLGDMKRKLQLHFLAWILALVVVPVSALGWTIPGHMLNGAITYQILSHEKPSAIANVKTILEQHPWYGSRWRAQLEKLPEAERDEILFMLAPRWSDDIRTQDRDQHRGPWHYINFPFKPEGQPPSVQARPPQSVNILTALADNERIVKKDSDPVKKAIALTWLFHLAGDIHQPLHSVQVFTADYPKGDRGGNQICVRPSATSKPMDLHRFWDGIITSSSNLTRLRNEATTVRNRPEFERVQLTELSSPSFESWATESAEIAVKMAYQNGKVPGSPRGDAKTCDEAGVVKPLANGYPRIAGKIADRRIILAGFRLADILKLL